MLVVKKIKIEVTPSDAATLEFMQGKCRGLYNWWVMKLRNGESWPGTLIAKKTLKESRKVDLELNAVYNKLLRLGPHTHDECGVLQEDGLEVAGMGPAQVA